MVPASFIWPTQDTRSLVKTPLHSGIMAKISVITVEIYKEIIYIFMHLHNLFVLEQKLRVSAGDGTSRCADNTAWNSSKDPRFRGGHNDSTSWTARRSRRGPRGTDLQGNARIALGTSRTSSRSGDLGPEGADGDHRHRPVRLRDLPRRSSRRGLCRLHGLSCVPARDRIPSGSFQQLFPG